MADTSERGEEKMSATSAGTGENGTTTRTASETTGEATGTRETLVLRTTTATTTTTRALKAEGAKDDGTTVTTVNATHLHPDKATKVTKMPREVREDSVKDRIAVATTDSTTGPGPMGSGLRK